MIKQIKGFTLVELIVVITILAILSTIGFVSYSWYLAGSRDTNRISQIKAISEWLSLYSTNHSLPSPDSTSINIMSWTTDVIATQWYAWKNVLETITYSTEWVDPKDNTYYTYYLTASKKYFQLMAFLEEEDSLQSSIINNTIAVDYEVRYPTVVWAKLWILTTSLNEPLQIAVSTSIDITSTALSLKSYLKDSSYLSWSTTDFAVLWGIAEKGGRWYWISLSGTGFTYTDLDNVGCIDINSTNIVSATTTVNTPTEIAEAWQTDSSTWACYYTE